MTMTPEQIEAVRERFEQWYLSAHGKQPHLYQCHDSYTDPWVHHAWGVWKHLAAHESLHPSPADASADDRFFLDHGTIHDRATGRHLRSVIDNVFPEAEVHETLAMLNELWAEVMIARFVVGATAKLASPAEAKVGAVGVTDVESATEEVERMRFMLQGLVDSRLCTMTTISKRHAEIILAALRDKRRIDFAQECGGVSVQHWGGSNPWTAEGALDDDEDSTQREGDSARDALDNLRAALEAQREGE